jgi:hypothetical protein
MPQCIKNQKKNEDKVAIEVSTIKIMKIYKSDQHLTSIFGFPLDYNVFERIGGSRWVCCDRGICGGCGPT